MSIRARSYREVKQQAQINANRTKKEWLAMEYDAEGGFAILLLGTSAKAVSVHGLFETHEDAQAYIDGGASLRQDDGTYKAIKDMDYRILPLTVQG